MRVPLDSEQIIFTLLLMWFLTSVWGFVWTRKDVYLFDFVIPWKTNMTLYLYEGVYNIPHQIKEKITLKTRGKIVFIPKFFFFASSLGHSIVTFSSFVSSPCLLTLLCMILKTKTTMKISLKMKWTQTTSQYFWTIYSSFLYLFLQIIFNGQKQFFSTF